MMRTYIHMDRGALVYAGLFPKIRMSLTIALQMRTGEDATPCYISPRLPKKDVGLLGFSCRSSVFSKERWWSTRLIVLDWIGRDTRVLIA